MTKTLLPILICIYLSASSCCSRKHCEAEPLADIRLIGFTLEEVDTIYIIVSTSPTDTGIITGVYSTTDSSEMILSQKPFMTVDVDIIIPAADRQYKLTDFVYDEEKSHCDECLFNKKVQYDFVGCKVNGVYHEEGFALAK